MRDDPLEERFGDFKGSRFEDGELLTQIVVWVHHQVDLMQLAVRALADGKEPNGVFKTIFVHLRDRLTFLEMFRGKYDLEVGDTFQLQELGVELDRYRRRWEVAVKRARVAAAKVKGGKS